MGTARPTQHGLIAAEERRLAIVVGAGALGLALLLGVVAVPYPGIAVALAVALAFVIATFWSIEIGFALFVAVLFVEALPAGSGLSAAKLAGGVLVLTWVAVLATDRTLMRRSFANAHPWMTSVILLFITWALASAVWAVAAGSALGSVGRYAPNLLLLPIAYTALRRRRGFLLVATTFLVGALGSSLYGLITAGPTSADIQQDRLGGSGVDPNTLALALVGALALALGLAFMRSLGPAKRIAAGLAGVGCGVCILLTGSRGGLISLVVLLILCVAFGIPRPRRLALALVVLLAAAGTVYVVAAAPQDIRDRMTRLSDGGSGRTDIWKVGLRMARANPVIGVGADNYTVRAVDYLLEPGAVKRTDFIVDTPKVAHNTPLHVLAELGVIGFGLLLTVLLFSVACGVRAWRAFESRGDPEMATFARAVTAAQISMLVAACFISAQYNKPMWLMLSLTPALLALARAGRPEASR